MAPQQEFESIPDSVAAVRRLVRDHLPSSTQTDDLVLIASELATNVVNHARTDFAVSIEGSDPVRLEISDGSSILPAVADLADGSGRGLRIVDTLATRWGVDATPSGKVVWVELGGEDAADGSDTR
jgi:anti-sigma regulatory factor (Ser/Thr protein kinase)